MAKNLLSVLLSIILLAGILSPGYSAEKMRFGLATRLYPIYYLIAEGAEEKGFWKQNGLEVDTTVLRASPAFYQALAAGSIDLGISMSPPLFIAVAGGLPAKIVADLAPMDPFFIWVLGGSPIRAASDLKGAKLGTSAIGGLTHTYGRVVVRALGIEKDVRWVGTGGIAETMAALKAGGIQANLSALFIGNVAEFKIKGELREVVNVNDFFPAELSAHVAVAQSKFIREKKETIRRALKAILQTADAVLKDQAWTVERIRRAQGLSQPAAELTYQNLRFSKGAEVSKKGLENLRNILIEFGVLASDKAPSGEEMRTAEFAS